MLKEPFGKAQHPLGTAQATITIGHVAATVEVRVVQNLLRTLNVGLVWGEAIPFDYIERYRNATHSIEWISHSCTSASMDSLTSHFVTLIPCSIDKSLQLESAQLHEPGGRTDLSAKTDSHCTPDFPCPDVHPKTPQRDVICLTIHRSIVSNNSTVREEAHFPHLLTSHRVRDSVCSLNQLPDVRGKYFAGVKHTLLENVKVFATPDRDLGLCEHVQHSIELTDSKPVRMQPYSTSETNKKFIRAETNGGLREGIIRPSKSPCASPVLVKQPHHTASRPQKGFASTTGSSMQRQSNKLT